GLRAARARWRGGRRAARGLRRRVRLHRRQEPAARVRAPGSAGSVSLGLPAPAPAGVDPARLAAAYSRCARIARGHDEHALLGALRRDAAGETAAFASFADVLDYCRCSADPVGRIVLALFGYRAPERQARADDICTALQLTNFWQDVAGDLARGRVYIPQEDLDRFPESRAALAAGATNDDFRRLLAFEVARTRDLFARGLPLAELVTGRLAREVRLFARGG